MRWSARHLRLCHPHQPAAAQHTQDQAPGEHLSTWDSTPTSVQNFRECVSMEQASCVCVCVCVCVCEGGFLAWLFSALVVI